MSVRPAKATERTGTAVHRVIARLNIGGPAIHVVELTAGLTAHGFATTLIAGALGSGEGDMSYRAHDLGITVVPIPELDPSLNPWRDLRALVRLVRLFREHRPLIVHTHTAKAGALGRIAAVLARVPVRVHTYHGHVLGGAYFPAALTRTFVLVERALARVTSRILVVSPSQKKELSALLRVEPERLRVVPLGFDLDPFLHLDRKANRQRARQELGLDQGASVVGIVGRLAPVKNHELILDAFARMCERAEAPLQLAVVGSGAPAREEWLRFRAEELGIGAQVRWLGWVRHMPDVYAALDVLALTSHDEGTPVAVIEAVASGLPVVARSVGGVADVLGPQVPGTLVGSAAVEPFVSALRSALTSVPEPEAVLRGRQAIALSYGRERLFRDLAEIYREALADTDS